jgi:FkbM family methyltransferase
LLPKPIETSIRGIYWRAKSDFLYRRLYRALNLKHVLPSGITLKVASRGEWWAYNEIFVNGEYDVPIQRALELRSKAQAFTVLDLGANVGYFTLRVLHLMRQSLLQGIACDMTVVEGSPATFGELQSRLGKQDLSPATVRVIHGLVGRHDGSGVIHQSALHVKNSIMETADQGGATVAFVDLVQLMEGRPEIDLLKCDIEGAELIFIEHYRDLFSRVRSAVFEIHHKLCDTDRCILLLEQAGLRQRVLRSGDETSLCFFSKDF